VKCSLTGKWAYCGASRNQTGSSFTKDNEYVQDLNFPLKTK